MLGIEAALARLNGEVGAPTTGKQKRTLAVTSDRAFMEWSAGDRRRLPQAVVAGSPAGPDGRRRSLSRVGASAMMITASATAPGRFCSSRATYGAEVTAIFHSVPTG
jgi:hypothetical protein